MEKLSNNDIFADSIKGKHKLSGQVVEVLPNSQFKVEIKEQSVTIRCYPSGKMQMNRIKIMLGDKVDIEVPKSIRIQNSIGRITYRHK